MTYQRQFAPSPVFSWSNSAISDDNTYNVSWETQNTRTQKYLPFTLTRIVNNSNYAVYFYPNQDTNIAILVPKGVSMTIDSATVPALRSFAIQRAETGTINAGEIRVESSKEGQTPTNVLQRLHERLFGKKNAQVV